jgi:hypothetical protein
MAAIAKTAINRKVPATCRIPKAYSIGTGEGQWRSFFSGRNIRALFHFGPYAVHLGNRAACSVFGSPVRFQAQVCKYQAMLISYTLLAPSHEGNNRIRRIHTP